MNDVIRTILLGVLAASSHLVLTVAVVGAALLVDAATGSVARDGPAQPPRVAMSPAGGR